MGKQHTERTNLPPLRLALSESTLMPLIALLTDELPLDTGRGAPSVTISTVRSGTETSGRSLEEFFTLIADEQKLVDNLSIWVFGGAATVWVQLQRNECRVTCTGPPTWARGKTGEVRDWAEAHLVWYARIHLWVIGLAAAGAAVAFDVMLFSVPRFHVDYRFVVGDFLVALLASWLSLRFDRLFPNATFISATVSAETKIARGLLLLTGLLVVIGLVQLFATWKAPKGH
jgi:hypothetical protein